MKDQIISLLSGVEVVCYIRAEGSAFAVMDFYQYEW